MHAMRLSAAVLALAGCGTHHDSDPNSDPDGGSSDPNCHFDCFGAIECSDGKAIAWAHAPVRCSEWTGQCPHVAVTCEGGCALVFRNNAIVDYEWQNPDRLRALCAETPTAEVGDLCNEGSCVPIRAATAGDGTATLSYLACHPATHTCAVADPPMIDRYLSGCPRAAVNLDRALREGVVFAAPDQTFELQWCLVARNDTGAVRHGLTLSCIGDWDCPAGSTCDTFLDSTFGTYPRVAVCRPGPRGASLFDRLR